MSEAKSYFCVGGPKDGQKVALLYGRIFRVLSLPYDPIHVGARLSEELTTISFVDYVPESFGSRYEVMVPSGQAKEETIRLLLNHLGEFVVD